MKRYLLLVLVVILAACAALDYNPYEQMKPTPTPAATATVSPVISPISDDTPSPTSTPVPLCVVTVSEALNARSGPGVSYPVLFWLYPGDLLEVTQQSNGWDFVRTQGGRTGWVNQSYCR